MAHKTPEEWLLFGFIESVIMQLPFPIFVLGRIALQTLIVALVLIIGIVESDA